MYEYSNKKNGLYLMKLMCYLLWTFYVSKNKLTKIYNKYKNINIFLGLKNWKIFLGFPRITDILKKVA